MSTVKTMPAKAKRPRIERATRTFVNSTKRLNRFRKAIAETTMKNTREVCLDIYWSWTILFRLVDLYDLNKQFVMRYVEASYPAPRKLRGISPSARLRERLYHFQRSIQISWHEASCVEKQKVQAVA